jgi:hypothetical protein
MIVKFKQFINPYKGCAEEKEVNEFLKEKQLRREDIVLCGYSESGIFWMFYE